ncbi:uncharacterized protein PG998_012538 [Apiospora kogelbergensis]|uniref:Pal1 cell morphology protein n=1 Tax=Apiospora kogelbergensis TaxID=1337665 RepID=A0AAW0QSR4_9PEZI
MFADQSGRPTSSAGRSPGLTLNLSSNNPFRNRAASPNGSSSFSPPPPHSPFDDPPPRPVSRNPFLDPNSNNNTTNTFFPVDQIKSPDSMASKDGKSPTAEELFDNLTLEEKNGQKAPLRPMNRPPPGGPPRGENMPPRGRGPPPRGGPPHRPSRSQEEAMRARKTHGPHASAGGEKSLLDPKRGERRPSDRRPRRNSDTSIMEREKPLTEEEKKLREMRRRERERRHRERKEGDAKDPKKPSKRLDLIDQLDATSIYGTGLFHHDGPFDALNPHRNRGGRRAPMQAFPEGSLNNSLGGSGPLNARPDHATFMGHHDDEAHKDYNISGKDRNGYDINGNRRGEPIIFDPSQRSSILHGDESIGLGTSTFLEGTPAARTAIQRREAETAQENMEGGLQRKKSLAQRIRGINRPPRDYNGGRFTNPEAAYGPRSGDSTGERNPFFDEFDKDNERITIKGKDNPRSPGTGGGRSPGPIGLERRATSDSVNEAPAKPQGGGFLTRMKSLKGGKRQRPEVPPHASPAPPTPGTAV